MQDFPLANSNFLAVALYMATTAMVDWIKVLEVCVSNRTTLLFPRSLNYHNRTTSGCRQQPQGADLADNFPG